MGFNPYAATFSTVRESGSGNCGDSEDVDSIFSSFYKSQQARAAVIGAPEACAANELAKHVNPRVSPSSSPKAQTSGSVQPQSDGNPQLLPWPERRCPPGFDADV